MAPRVFMYSSRLDAGPKNEHRGVEPRCCIFSDFNHLRILLGHIGTAADVEADRQGVPHGYGLAVLATRFKLG